jgi:hypothetical protein
MGGPDHAAADDPCQEDLDRPGPDGHLMQAQGKPYRQDRSCQAHRCCNENEP